jgi:hypothetical protein
VPEQDLYQIEVDGQSAGSVSMDDLETSDYELNVSASA